MIIKKQKPFCLRKRRKAIDGLIRSIAFQNNFARQEKIKKIEVNDIGYYNLSVFKLGGKLLDFHKIKGYNITLSYYKSFQKKGK